MQHDKKIKVCSSSGVLDVKSCIYNVTSLKYQVCSCHAVISNKTILGLRQAKCYFTNSTHPPQPMNFCFGRAEFTCLSLFHCHWHMC